MNNAQPGRYFIGDPCYVINNISKDRDEVWDRYCNYIFKFPESNVFVDPVMNVTIVAEGTAYGDGLYDGKHRKYGVDAGLLGVATVAHCTEEELKRLEKLGFLYDFVHGPVVSETAGIITIYDGEVEIEHIDTIGDDDDDDGDPFEDANWDEERDI